MDHKHFSVLLEIVELFVQKNKKDRITELLSKPKRYRDGLWDLLHDPYYSFDPRVIIEIPSNEQTIEMIEARLKRSGFQNRCFVISLASEFDGQEIAAMTALEDICCHTDSMLFCPKSKLAYYEGHEGWRYILKPVK